VGKSRKSNRRRRNKRRDRKLDSTISGRRISPYKTYEFEATRGAGATVVIVHTATSDIDTNHDAINDNIIIKALTRHIDAVPGADVYRSTELDSYGDYIVYAAELLVELRAQKFLMDAVPAITRNDASAGAPFTRASWNGLIGSLIGTHIPYMSMNIAAMLTTPLLLWPGNPVFGYSDMYFYPMQPELQLTEVETLLSSMAGEFDGLAGSNQLNRLGRPFAAMDVQYRKPQSWHSGLGQAMKYYYPAADDANQKEHVRDATLDLIYDRYLGLPLEYDYAIPMYCIGATAGYDWIINTAGAANKVNLEYGEIGDTGLTAVPDYAADAANNIIRAGWSWTQNLITGAIGFNTRHIPGAVQKDNFLPDENAVLRRFISALQADITGEVFYGPGLIRRSTQPIGFYTTQAGSTGKTGGMSYGDRAAKVASDMISRGQEDYTRGGRGEPL
jgi:hypothetical protein